jgi:hypothetical protein
MATTATTAPAVPRRSPKPAAAVPAARPAGAQDQRFRTIQLALFTGGAVLMPLGIIAIMLGWSGTAHTKYQYNQLPYVVSGGLLGLGLVFLGGFLYFGAMLARMATEQRESTRQLADAMIALADHVGRGPVPSGAGSTVHRRDCALIAHRQDLRPLTGAETDLGTCRVCRPSLD